MITPEMFLRELTSFLWIAPILTGVGQLIKMTFPKLKRYISLVTALMGTGIGIAITGFPILGGLTGLAVGLMATGLYEAGSTAIRGK